MSHFNSTILITGGTTGLNYRAAETIAKGNPDSLVIIASRSSADNADETINKSIGQHNVKYLPLDLSTLASVRDFVSCISSHKNCQQNISDTTREPRRQIF
jgi:NAD(P)-dependent dehydrogenase (short-subunit alcohol dehydrogenase family)